MTASAPRKAAEATRGVARISRPTLLARERAESAAPMYPIMKRTLKTCWTMTHAASRGTTSPMLRKVSPRAANARNGTAPRRTLEMAAPTAAAVE